MQRPHASTQAARGAVILCGGESSRMGQDKASLPFGGETLLARVLRLIGPCVPANRIVIVAGRDQQLPPLPDGTRVVRDARPSLGPLPALAAGLAEMAAEGDAAFVTACDAPLIEPAAVEWLFARLEAQPEVDAVVPADADRCYSLFAVYRGRWRDRIAAAIAGGKSSLQRLVRSAALAVDMVPVEELRAVDPDLRSLVNCNTPEDYERALREARG